jgi:phage/plasmid-associated DNA primase
LAREAPGVLAWCLRGCLDWQRDGLREPAIVSTLTAEYRSENDPLTPFLAECCALDPNASTGGQELFHAYHQWADAQQVAKDERLSQRTFGTRIKARFKDVGTPRKVRYQGLRLAEQGDLLISTKQAACTIEHQSPEHFPRDAAREKLHTPVLNGADTPATAPPEAPDAIDF